MKKGKVEEQKGPINTKPDEYKSMRYPEAQRERMHYNEVLRRNQEMEVHRPKQ